MNDSFADEDDGLPRRLTAPPPSMAQACAGGFGRSPFPLPASTAAATTNNATPAYVIPAALPLSAGTNALTSSPISDRISRNIASLDDSSNSFVTPVALSQRMVVGGGTTSNSNWSGGSGDSEKKRESLASVSSDSEVPEIEGELSLPQTFPLQKAPSFNRDWEGGAGINNASGIQNLSRYGGLVVGSGGGGGGGEGWKPQQQQQHNNQQEQNNHQRTNANDVEEEDADWILLDDDGDDDDTAAARRRRRRPSPAAAPATSSSSSQDEKKKEDDTDSVQYQWTSAQWKLKLGFMKITDAVAAVTDEALEKIEDAFSPAKENQFFPREKEEADGPRLFLL